MAKPAAVARLRRTFHYPSSDEDDDASASPAVLDEQEQETLIATLARQNGQRNQTTHRLLCALALLAALPFLLDLFSPPSPSSSSPARRAAAALPALGLSSLLATGWTLARLDVTETGFASLDGMHAPVSPSQGQGRGRSRSRSRSRQRRPGALGGRGRGGGILGVPVGSGAKSPLETYLPWLNVALAALALLTGLLQRLKTGPVAAGVSPLMLGALPGVVYAVVIGAKVIMASVDPERELSALKYAYKGA
ncbi:hypothetical protein VTH06DRAFT_1703 [Thermothelomyces fergusii]